MMSIMFAECHQHQRGGTYRVEVTWGDQPLPSRLESIPCPQKKQDSTSSTADAVMANIPVCIVERQILFCIHWEWLFRLSSSDGESASNVRILELCSSQDEPDTRLLLHVGHAANHHTSAAMLQSPNTDVAVLCCCIQSCKSSQFEPELNNGLAMLIFQLSLPNFQSGFVKYSLACMFSLV